MKVKIYGSPIFTPVGSGEAGDEVQPRAAAGIWAGQVATDLYGNYAWRTNDTFCFDTDVPPSGNCGGDWCYGSYARDDFSNIVAAGCKCGYGGIQDGDDNTGWQINPNWAQNKRVLLRAGTDLASGALIHYVRIHVKFVYNDGVIYKIKPYYQVIGTQGDPSAPFPAGATGFTGVALTEPLSNATYFRGPSRNKQYSEKFTSSPVSGRDFDKDSLIHTAWGIWSEKAGGGDLHVSEMAIEVGYEESPYVVITGTASPSATSAIVRGSVDPKGDPSGTWFFEYGETPFFELGPSAEVPAPSTENYNVVLTLNGLNTEVTHYYRLVARDSEGALHYGATKTFFTISMCSTRSLLVY